MGQTPDSGLDMNMLKLINALHKRLALQEMTNHEFIDDTYKKERTTFADGTTVTVDREAGTFDIQPPVKLGE